MSVEHDPRPGTRAPLDYDERDSYARWWRMAWGQALLAAVVRGDAERVAQANAGRCEWETGPSEDA